MAIEIVKRGINPDDNKKPKKETCYNCKTVFTYQKEDIQPDRDGPYVVCPVCKKFIAAK